MPSTTTHVTAKAGTEQLRRRWAVDKPRAALLLVHGIAEHSGRYDHVGSYFADHGIDAISFDLRGHGESAGRRGHVDSFDDHLDDVEEMLDERRTLGVPTVLMGHSLGGLICATYMVRGRPAPDLLVLSSPALAADVPGWQRVAATVLGRVAPTTAIKSDLDGALLSRDESVGARYRDDPLRVQVTTARSGSQMFAAMRSTTEHLDRITIPTYVLHGSEDRLVPPSASEPFTALPNATRVLHPGLRHECFNEPERAEVLAGVLAWLDGQLATGSSPAERA